MATYRFPTGLVGFAASSLVSNSIMKAASVSYVVAHLVALAQAAPTDIPNGLVGEDVNRGPESQAFSVNQIHNEGFRPLDAPAALIRAHFKYSDTLPRQLRNAIEMNPDLRSRFSSLLLAGKVHANHSHRRRLRLCSRWTRTERDSGRVPHAMVRHSVCRASQHRNTAADHLS
jgi:hypothetical protein